MDENTEGKGPIGRPRHWWMNNIKVDLGEMGWGGMVIKFQVP
jgi:hypothetical protein